MEKTVNWVNENLVGGTEMKTMCQTVRTCELVERETEKTIRVPRQQCDNVPFTRKKCGSVQVEQAPVEVPTMDYRRDISSINMMTMTMMTMTMTMMMMMLMMMVMMMMMTMTMTMMMAMMIVAWVMMSILHIIVNSSPP